MKKFISKLLLSLLLFTTIITPSTVYGAQAPSTFKWTPSQEGINLKNTQRKLWIDHVSWTRNFIISNLASLKDTDAVAQRLLKNQDDIGNTIKPYYSEEAGNTLSKLLREHILTAAQVVNAAKSNDKLAFEKYNKLWYQNADEIANFLSSANPNWKKEEVTHMLYTHLQLTTDEVVSRLNQDFKADIEAYDKGEDHMIEFADMISSGIIKQFPEKFKR